MVIDKPRLPGVAYAGRLSQCRLSVPEGGRTMRVTWG